MQFFFTHANENPTEMKNLLNNNPNNTNNKQNHISLLSPIFDLNVSGFFEL